MGAVNDSEAVVDPLLRIRGMKGIRVVDASIFAQMVTANPMITVSYNQVPRLFHFLKIYKT